MKTVVQQLADEVVRMSKVSRKKYGLLITQVAQGNKRLVAAIGRELQMRSLLRRASMKRWKEIDQARQPP